MSLTLTVTEVARHFAEYVNRVAYRRESFVLVKGNKPVAELRPLPSGGRLGEVPALLASLPRLSTDDVDSFASDIAAARAELAQLEVRDQWES